MKQVAVISFPGTNNEVESVRAIRRAGMEAHCFKWNDDPATLRGMDAYFLVGGFSYEDRGRSGMIAARDPVLKILQEEAAKGKVIVGHCNGAQILIESGLVPLGDGLRMSLARNAVKRDGNWFSPGFINEWIWIKPACKSDRCATSNWGGTLHIPIAHGEGRYVTTDPELIEELRKNDQIAFQYCSEDGTVSMDEKSVPNGSTEAIAGICNPAGNVIALMPHPERTPEAVRYFESLKMWLEKNQRRAASGEWQAGTNTGRFPLPTTHSEKPLEIFIDTIIVNNEERTVEQALHRILPSVKLKQYRFLAPTEKPFEEILSTISIFNPNKEIAFVRKGKETFQWNSSTKALDSISDPVVKGVAILRRDIPDTGSSGLGKGSETGICYDIRESDEQKLYTDSVLEILGNPHASILERIV